jgi:hypothetical protein
MFETLRQEIAECRTYCEQARSREGHFILDQVLVRYLWGATSNAQVILTAAESSVNPIGAGPSLRHIFEAFFDLVYLFRGYGDYGPDATDEEQSAAWDEAAARVLVWDLLQWQREWDLHEDAVEVDESLAAAGAQQEAVEQTFATVCDQARAVGVDTGFLEQLFEEEREKQIQGARRSWHWSGKSFSVRLQAIRQRTAGEGYEGEESDPGAWASIFAMLKALYPGLSDVAHPPPGWKLLALEHNPDGSIVAPDPTHDGEERLSALMVNAQGLLSIIRTIVSTALAD